jgi:hypothetical protein
VVTPQSDCVARLTFVMHAVDCMRISRNSGEPRRMWCEEGWVVGLKEAAILGVGAGIEG